MTHFGLWSHGILQVKYGNAFVLIMLLFILGFVNMIRGNHGISKHGLYTGLLVIKS